MHFYWRIIEELKFIGETWVIKDPSLKRNFEQWRHLNAQAIALSTMSEPMEDLKRFHLRISPYCRN